MVATEFIQQLDRLKFVEAVGLDDFADKCSYMLSFVVLIMCFTIVALKSYVLDPFVCYLPTTISGSNYVSFVNAFCWINGTVPANSFDNRFDYQENWDKLEPLKMNYYQWVALVLALQAMLCYLPRLIWEAVTFNRVGTNLGFLIDTAQSASREVDKSRQNKIHFIAKSLDTLLFARRPLKSRYEDFPQDKPLYRTMYETVFGFMPKKRLGSALAFYYIFTKFLYLTNAIVQLVIMEHFLGIKNSNGFFGLTILNSVLSGAHWNETKIFPRVGFCRVPVKLTHSAVKHFIVQCSLPINMLNEKIYIFLWFWFMFISALEVIAISVWIMRLIIRKNRIKLLVRYFKVADSLDDNVIALLPKFEDNVLRQDGCFLLHMIRLNAGEIVAYEVLQKMFKIYLANNPEEMKEISAPPPESSSFDEKLHSSSTIDKRIYEHLKLGNKTSSMQGHLSQSDHVAGFKCFKIRYKSDPKLGKFRTKQILEIVETKLVNNEKPELCARKILRRKLNFTGIGYYKADRTIKNVRKGSNKPN